MSDAVAKFFDTWGLSDDAERLSQISALYTEAGTYADPRSGDALSGVEAIAGYVNMFSANAPGWSASVVKSDTIAGALRVTVAFGGAGPDGTEMVQHGQYFVDMDGDKIARMVGFVGTGAPE